MAEEFYSIGKGEIRQDALLKVTGQAEYTTDIHPRGMVYGKILGSPIPHGIIKSIDTSEAEKLPGVVCVVTGEDGPDHPTIGGYLTDRYIMNRVGQKVRYVGDFVAAVAATDEQIAEAACKLIKVEYEPLPYVLDVEEAFREDCPAVVHEDVQSYKRLDLHGVAHCMDKKHPNQAIRRKVRHSESFDLDPDSFETPEAYDEAFEKKFNEEFDKAYLKLPTQRYEFPRVSHCFMEPHVSVVVPLVDGGIELWSSEQGGRLIKNSMSSAFGLKPSDFHVHVPFMGGGWAPEGKLVGKGVFMPEQALNNPRNAQGNPVLFYSIGGWGMEVGVNIETGEVKLMQAGGFYDAGRVINRKTCEGQIEGALSMGLGQAVFEEIMINDKGKVINGNYRDYKVPTFMDNPNNEHVKVDFVGEPFATGPNGAKGIGEVAMIPVMAAVANAINAAAGAEIHNIPMTRERVLQALRDKEAADKK